MSIKRNLIIKLLDDSDIVDFEENLLFREELLEDPEAIKFLLEIMRTDSHQRRGRARKMLLEFSDDSLPEISKVLSLQGANWRNEIVEIISTIASMSDQDKLPSIYQAIKLNVMPLLNDSDWIEHDFKNPVEIEYKSRVCDEAYMLCKYLLVPDFFDGDFLDLNEQYRNREISTFRSRIDQNLFS